MIQARRFDSLGQTIGNEFTVNDNGSVSPSSPQVAGDANTVIVWDTNGLDGDFGGVSGKRLDSDGNSIGEEFLVNTYTINNQLLPDVALMNLQTFVVVWQSLLQDGDANGIFAQRFDSAGNKAGTEFPVNVNTSVIGAQFRPAVGASAETGNFVVVWVDDTIEGNFGIFGQRFTSAGVAVGTEFQVDAVSTGQQYGPDIVSMVDDSFVVTWVSEQARGVVARRFDSDGAPIGGELQVSTATMQYALEPAISADEAGDFVISWQDGPETGAGLDGDEYGVFARRFASDGSPTGPQFQVNLATAYSQSLPALDVTFDGNFIVAFETDYYGTQIKAQRFLATCGNGTVDTWETCDPPDGTTCSNFCQSISLPVGPEFQANTSTLDAQRFPDVAVSSFGNFLVVWTEAYPGDRNIRGQLYEQDRDQVGLELQITSLPPGQHEYAARAAAQAGTDFVVVWASNGEDGAEGGIFGMRFDSTGTQLGTKFPVNTTTAGSQGFPDVATGLTPNDFVVVWSTYSDGEVTAQRFDGSAAPIGTELQISPQSSPFLGEHRARIAENSSGAFIVVWADDDGNNSGVFARRFDSASNPVGAPFQVNTFTVAFQGRPAVGLNDAGGFIVTWGGVGPPDGSVEGAFARRYASNGSPIGVQFIVNTYTGDVLNTDVEIAGDGSFVVTWAIPADGDSDGIRARRFNSLGAPLGLDFQVNTYTRGPQGYPAVDGTPSGDFVVVWESGDVILPHDGDEQGIFGQFFRGTCGNGIVEGDEVCDPPNGGTCLPNCQGMG